MLTMFAAYRRRYRTQISGKTEGIKREDTCNGITSPKTEVPMEIVWENVAVYVIFHLAAVHGLYLLFTSAMLKTSIFGFFWGLFAGLGITAGVHRLWCHRSYKAKLPLRIFLALANAAAMQKDIYYWSRDHRTHHKFSETNADPHNAKRGFFFSHVGWLLCRKHPAVIEKGDSVDLSDLLEDPVVRFQRKYYTPLAFLMCFVLPTVIPMILWQEILRNSFFVATIFRYVLLFNFTVLVNSAAHMWGNRPYDKRINPADNYWVSLLAGGEGFHNYHHTFPWDYAASEYGTRLSISTAFINFCASVGLAYDLKTVSPAIIQARKLKNMETE